MTRKVRRFIFQLMPIILLCGFALGLLTMKAVQPNETKSWASYAFSADAHEVDPPLPILSLVDIIDGATTNADAQAALRTYYDANAELLAALFMEPNEQRTRAFFGMYIVHLAQPYNTVAWDYLNATILDFVAAPTAHCGAYAVAQSQVYTALGLRWRNIVVDNGWHGLIEAEIGERWETFDSTNNLWLSVSVEELLAGVPRSWRTFYTPQTDVNAPAQYRDHLADDYNMQYTRTSGTQWGLTVFPRRWEIIAQSSVANSLPPGD